jgi:hypothetical protein
MPVHANTVTETVQPGVPETMKQRLTLDEMRAIAAAWGGRCLSTLYVNNAVQLEWECARGHRWFAGAREVRKGTWCQPCKLRDKASSKLALLHGRAATYGGRCIAIRWGGPYEQAEVECVAGHRWSMSVSDVLRGKWCRICAATAAARTRIEQAGKYRTEQLARANHLATVHSGRCLSSQYVNARTTLEWECAAGHRWSARPYKVASGNWCLACARAQARERAKAVMRAIPPPARNRYLPANGSENDTDFWITRIRARDEDGHDGTD